MLLASRAPLLLLQSRRRQGRRRHFSGSLAKGYRCQARIPRTLGMMRRRWPGPNLSRRRRPMARRFFLDATGVIFALSDNPEAPLPPDATEAVLESVIRQADPPGADGRIQGGGSWIAGVYTAPNVGASLADRLARQLHEAYKQWQRESYSHHWVNLRSGDNAQLPLTALSRWAFHLVAIGLNIAQGGWPAAPNRFDAAAKREAVDYIVAILEHQTHTEFLHFAAQADVDDPTVEAVTEYATMSIDGGQLYSDVFFVDGTHRPLDGARHPRGGMMAAGFNPESQTLLDP